MLGRLAVVLRFDNTQMTVASVTGGEFMPTPILAQSFNDVCAGSIYCTAPQSCGEVQFIGGDTTNSSFGSKVLFRVNLFTYTDTVLTWGPCSNWCDPPLLLREHWRVCRVVRRHHELFDVVRALGHQSQWGSAGRHGR